MIKTANISPDGKCRYTLSRIWNDDLPKVLFVMHNPSKADASQDDPTITRCINFAKSWGYGGIYVGNVCPYRATNPKDLDTAILPAKYIVINDAHLENMAKLCELHVLAHGVLHKRIEYMANLLYLNPTFKFNALGLTKAGHPRHPLYLPSISYPVPFKP